MLGMNEEWEDLEGPGSMMPYRSVVCSLTIPDEPDPLTTFIIAALAFACAAFCVWLTVRIVNRRERWAKWTAVLVAFVVLVGYPLSFGPACWINLRTGSGSRAIGAFYRPIGWLYLHSGDALGEVIGAWANLGSDDDQRFYGLTDDGPFWLGDLVSGTFLLP
jgi:hypothetical protein